MAGKASGKVTLQDVAVKAGVGSATVDRVLNERGNVSNAVRIRVIDAARELGLRRILPSAYRRTVRVNVILSRVERPLLKRMAAEVGRLGQRFDKAIAIHRTLLGDEDPRTVAAAMLKGAYDAVIVCAPDHPLIHEAIAELKDRTCPVVTLISDVPGAARLAYAGTDHVKAGRSAAYFLAHMVPPADPSGKVIVLCHDEGFQAHAERIRGFAEQLASDGSTLELAEIVRGGDDPLLSEAKLKEAFRRHPDTVGLYNAGGANRGVITAMAANLLPRRPLFIGHELTGFTWRCLRDGLMTLTIDQSPELQAQYALEVVMHHYGFEGAVHANPPYVSDVPIILYGPQNLPDAPPD
ncbi:LacI family DNA-binding transcriptional regulator [Sagittula salina]|uniref:LacI family DNA-binding transcriptional regulator n=1 Tax=Sagittula salina TaxID=2820268 RepID=A0A940MSP5_9RHOB|nr:LacI family DNA-binding transcriptional regulator [Sagittula salina]MBP0485115.1 LacI family DNA-binding transcriptional regulator [Sagittula salina]